MSRYCFPSIFGLIGKLAFENLLVQLDFLGHSKQVKFESIRHYPMNSNIRFVQ